MLLGPYLQDTEQRCSLMLNRNRVPGETWLAHGQPLSRAKRLCSKGLRATSFLKCPAATTCARPAEFPTSFRLSTSNFELPITASFCWSIFIHLGTQSSFNMTWFEIRHDAKHRATIVKHKGEKPDTIPTLSLLQIRDEKAKRSSERGNAGREGVADSAALFGQNGREDSSAENVAGVLR